MFSKISAIMLALVMVLSMVGCQSSDTGTVHHEQFDLSTEVAVKHADDSDLTEIKAFDALLVSELVFAEDGAVTVRVKKVDSTNTLFAKLETVEAFDAYVDEKCNDRAVITMSGQTYYGACHEVKVASFEELGREIDFGNEFSFNFGRMYGIEKFFDEGTGQEVYRIEIKTVLYEGMITEFTFPNGIMSVEGSDANGYMVEDTTITIFDPYSVAVVVGY